PLAGPDVEHELAGPHPGGGDHPSRPFVSEPVPAPSPARPPGGGHDEPSPCRYPRAARSPPRPRPSIRFLATACRLAVRPPCGVRHPRRRVCARLGARLVPAPALGRSAVDRFPTGL